MANACDNCPSDVNPAQGDADTYSGALAVAAKSLDRLDGTAEVFGPAPQSAFDEARPSDRAPGWWMLIGIALLTAWTGVRPLTPDGRAIAGPVPGLEGLFDTTRPVGRFWGMYWRIGPGYRDRDPGY